MSNEFSCFVVSPIGKPDSEIRKAADEVLEYLIIPVLRNCGFQKNKIIRADKLTKPGRITNDVLALINNADLCIIDVTGYNPNVMYECGLRHGNGRPFLMLIKEGEELPFDIADIRTVQYDLSTVKKAHESQEALEQFVSGLIDTGFAIDSGTDSIGTIASMLRDVDRKVDALIKNFRAPRQSVVSDGTDVDDVLSQLHPVQAFNYALTVRDANLAEQLLPIIEKNVSKDYFISHAISQACALGSKYAADYIKDSWEYIVTSMPVGTQNTCIGAYVQYCNMKNSESENIGFITSCVDMVLDDNENIDNEIKASLLCQMSRIYYGAYVTDKEDETFLNKALEYISRAIDLNPKEPSFHYNKAQIQTMKHDIDSAKREIEKCLDLSQEDSDHLSLAYKIFIATNDPRSDEVIQKLERINKYIAHMIRRDPSL